MKIFLLTHELELNKATNTGAIAIKHAGDTIEKILWQRVNPNKQLAELIDNNQALLLYPAEESAAADIKDYDNIVIIDGTWQQSRKIFNKSTYLKKMPAATLKATEPSKYYLGAIRSLGGCAL